MKQHQHDGSTTLFLLRVVLGCLFFYAGWEKITAETPWTAAGFLKTATGPIKGYFISMAGSPIVDQLVIWGLLLIGACLVLGFMVRFACFWGIVMMLMFWAAKLPPAHGYIDDHIVYVFVFFALMANKAGLVAGIDGLLETKVPAIAKSRILRKIMG